LYVDGQIGYVGRFEDEFSRSFSPTSKPNSHWCTCACPIQRKKLRR